jgi:hypothetical protein
VEKMLYNISSKIDVIMMNLANLNRSLLPDQAIISRPPNLPPLPLNDIKTLEEFEKFISKDVNLSAAVNILLSSYNLIHFYYCDSFKTSFAMFFLYILIVIQNIFFNMHYIDTDDFFLTYFLFCSAIT